MSIELFPAQNCVDSDMLQCKGLVEEKVVEQPRLDVEVEPWQSTKVAGSATVRSSKLLSQEHSKRGYEKNKKKNKKIEHG